MNRFGGRMLFALDLLAGLVAASALGANFDRATIAQPLYSRVLR
jgi:hypothetical protein